jgi:hypothetical protein
MKNGNWIPLDKQLIKYLPKRRPYTELEAMFSLAFDFDTKRRWTYRGYAALWGWDRRKIKRFIDTLLSGAGYAPPNAPPKAPSIRFVFNMLEHTLHHKKHHSMNHTKDPYIKDPYLKNLINDKGVSCEETKKPSIPLSFNAFRKKYAIEDKEAEKAVEYFTERYKEVRGDKHPPLKPETWQYTLESILYADDDMHDTDALDADDLCVMIDKYFETKFDNCDYGICHFNTDGIKMRRFYEELY